KQVLRWIRARRPKEISLQNVRMDALGRAVDEAGAKAVVDALVGAAWLRPKHADDIRRVGRPALRWEPNPLCSSQIPETPETPTMVWGQQPGGNVPGLSGFSVREPVSAPVGGPRDGG